MTAADLAFAMRLKSEAGWNQLEADWQRFLAMQPDGCFVAELEGTAAGTAVATLFGPVAWIAMVLVESTLRGGGVGKALMRHALAFAEGGGAKSIRLDATPLGQPLYERLGFAPQYSLTRYAGALPNTGDNVIANLPAASMGVRTASLEDYSSMLALDRAVTNTPREKFLSRMFDERPDALRVVERGGRIAGYLSVRPGSDALQLGPCIAAAGAGGELLADAFQRYAGQRIYWDAPSDHSSAIRVAQAAGLRPQRHLLRMCRGELIQDDTTRLWASSGPELG